MYGRPYAAGATAAVVILDAAGASTGCGVLTFPSEATASAAAAALSAAGIAAEAGAYTRPLSG